MMKGDLDDHSLESELELIFNQRQNRVAIGDQERGMNMHRSGSAPPTVDGSLSAVGNLYRNNGDVHIEGRINNNGIISTNDQVLSEEELIRSHPMYLSYYYDHGNFNPRLPPPLLSKEDWRVAQRFQVSGSSSSDWWKTNLGNDHTDHSGSSSLFSMQPGLGLHKDAESELIEMRKAQKNNRESIVRNDGLIGLPTPTIGGRRKSFADILQEGLDEPECSSNRISRPASQNAIISNTHSSVLSNEKETSIVQHSFTPVVGPSSKTPGLPPMVRPADVASSLSNLSLSRNRLPDGQSYSRCDYLDSINDQRLSFQRDNSRNNNLGPMNFHRRAVSSADLNSNRNTFDFSKFEGPSIRNHVDSYPGMDLSGHMPTRYSAAHNHTASASSINTAGWEQYLRRCNYPPTAIDSRHGNLHQGRNNYVSNAHEDMRALPKVYLEALLAQQNQQNGSPLFGRSGSLNHIHGNHTYDRGVAYHGNLLEKTRPLSKQERKMQFSPVLRNSVAGSVAEISLDRRPVLSLLDELKNNKNRSLELSDVVGHVIEFSTDQYGSRFIQQKLETATIEEKNLIFPEIIPHAHGLMTDVFGNYVIQKFFEHGTESQRKELADQLIGHVLPLSLQMYGCRVIQKALEVVDVDHQKQMVDELNGSVMKCVCDQNGNHVIQKCIECVPQDQIQFIISSFFGQVVSLSSHPYGCRVIQRVLEHSDDQNTQVVMDEIMTSVCSLAQDQYGNYVIQHVLQHGKPQERSAVISKLAGQIVTMSLQKFASNVAEKCLTYGTPEERQLLVKTMLGSTDENEPLQAMMKDPFGNYVVQKVLETCDDKSREIILSRIKVHLATLKRYTYGKHIVSRVEKLVTSGERHIASSTSYSS
ncbi:pumilio homolog 4-like [Rutidosis leptorrhynchoides]|uniref:pumilio homolog 4-like n=1 Tax=Rutidosis leptorrhynchoides TaxID=125765 RepID=UPI003A98DD1F